MTTCSVRIVTATPHRHHHPTPPPHPHPHPHPSPRFMGSGTGSHSGSGSGSNSPAPPPPPIKTEPREEEEDEEEEEDSSSNSNSSSSSNSKRNTSTAPSSRTFHCPPVGLLNHRNLVEEEKLVVATLATLNSGDPSNIIKQDLRLIIQSRRKAEGKGELQVDFTTPPKDELTGEEWEKVRKRRDQNRLAAQRFRQKQRKTSSTLSDRVRRLEAANMRLKTELETLETERQKLLTLVQQHSHSCLDLGVRPSQQLTSEELEKRARRRELNRLAAKRSREKGQRRKETLIQEIQGLQNRNGSLEGAMSSLVQERDSLVQTLKGHLPRCQDSSAMTRSAQLLAFSHRLAQLLDWTIPGPGSSPSALVVTCAAASSPCSGDPTMVMEVQAPPPAPTPQQQSPLCSPHASLPAPPPHPPSREQSHLPSPSSSSSTPLALGPAVPSAAFPSPGHLSGSNPELPSPSRRFSPAGGSHAHCQSEVGVGGRDLEIDASAAAVLREEIERRHHRHPYRLSAPVSPTFSPSQSSSQHPPFSSPRSSPPLCHPSSLPITPTPSHPSSLPITPTHLLPSPSRSLPPPLPSPSGSLPPFLPSPSHSLPPHLPSPSRSMPPFLPSPAHLHSPSHLPSPHSHLPSPHTRLPSPHTHLPSPSHSLPLHLPSPSSHPFPSPLSLLPSPHSHLPSPHSHLPSPHSHLPSPHSHLPSPHSHLLPSPSHSLPPPLPSPQSHLPSPAHSLPPPLPSPSTSSSAHPPFPSPHLLSPSLPHQPSHLALSSRDLGSQLVSYTGTQEESSRSPLTNPAIQRSPSGGSTNSVKRPQSLDLRGAGIFSLAKKKEPTMGSPIIPKKNPALRSPVVSVKKDPLLRSPTIPKKDPALRSPIIESCPAQPPVTQLTSSCSALRTSGVFKRGPVQRVASFHGVSAQNPGEQVTPLNLSKRRKSEDYGSLMGGGGDEEEEAGRECGQQGTGGFSGLRTWPPPGSGPWSKPRERESPLNLVCREQPSTATLAFAGAAQDNHPAQPHSPLTFGQLHSPLTFGQPHSPPAFGQPKSPPAFGQPHSPPAFGQPKSPPAFGQPKSPPAFGQPKSPPAFSRPKSPTVFGQPQSPMAFSQPKSPPAFSQPTIPMGFSQPKSPPAFHQEGQSSVDSQDEVTAAAPQRVMRFNSYNEPGTS